MWKYFTRRRLLPVFLFCCCDVLAIGFGMGIPIFAILLGFIVGWIIPAIPQSNNPSYRHALKTCLAAAFFAAGFSFIVLALIWGPPTMMLANPNANFQDFGIPMILYDPTASFIGWMVLMVILSPILQMLTTAFASSIRLAWYPPSALSRSTSTSE